MISQSVEVSETSSADADRLEEVWENAVRLSMKHAQVREGETGGDREKSEIRELEKSPKTCFFYLILLAEAVPCWVPASS